MEYLRLGVRCKIIRGRVFRYSVNYKEFVLSNIDIKDLKGFEVCEAVKPFFKPRFPSVNEIRQAMFDRELTPVKLSRRMGRDSQWVNRFFIDPSGVHSNTYKRIAFLLNMREYI